MTFLFENKEENIFNTSPIFSNFLEINPLSLTSNNIFSYTENQEGFSEKSILQNCCLIEHESPLEFFSSNDDQKIELHPKIETKSTSENQNKKENENSKKDLNSQNSISFFNIKKIEQETNDEGKNKNNDINNIKNTVDKIKKTYRLDYYKKHFKVKFSHWMTDYVNNLIEKSNFKKKIGKLSLPDSKSFTSNSKSSDNKVFLNFKIKEIFGFEDFNKKKSEIIYHIQEKNFQKIKNIENEKFSKENIKAYKKLIEFLNMNLEEAYAKFYSKEKYFKIFSEDKLTKFYDIYFIYEKGYSLLNKNGFIKLCKGEK